MAHRNNFVIAWLLLATAALAQSVDSSRTSDLARSDLTASALPTQVALARCPYSQADDGCPSQSVQTRSELGKDTALAQMPRRMAPMAGRQGPPMRGTWYPGMWGPQPSPAHALIGAAIGFGFGAAAGAKNGGARGSLAVGTLVGLLGAAIGASIPAFPSHYRYRRGWSDDDEASRTKPESPQPHSESVQKEAARLDPTDPPSRDDDPAQGATEISQNNAFPSR